MPFVDSDGWNVWYDVTGSGPPLVLCGGPIMMHNQFDPALPELNQHFTTINWNWRGAGNSDRTWMRGVTFDDWVDDLTRVLDELKIEQTDFWAVSTGSLFAIRFAARYPSRVGKMVLFPSMTGSSSTFHRFMAEMVAIQGIEHQIWNGFWLASSEEAIATGKVVAIALHEIELAKKNMPATVYERLSAVYVDVDLTPDVAKLKMPILLLLGASGRLGAKSPWLVAAIEKFKILCPQAQLVAIPAAGGTLAAIEQPKASVDAVRAFLAPQTDPDRSAMRATQALAL